MQKPFQRPYKSPFLFGALHNLYRKVFRRGKPEAKPSELRGFGGEPKLVPQSPGHAYQRGLNHQQNLVREILYFHCFERNTQVYYITY